MAAISDSVYPLLFQNGQNQSIFGLSQSGTNGMSQADVARQQKLMQFQLQQQAMANMHLQTMDHPAVHITPSLNGTSTPDTSSPLSVKLGDFSSASEITADAADAASSATSSANLSGSLSGTSSLNTSLSSSEMSALNGLNASQSDSLLLPSAAPKAKSPINVESSAISPVPVVNLGLTVTASPSLDGQVDGTGSVVSKLENDLDIAMSSADALASFRHIQQFAVSSTASDLDMPTSVGLGLNGIAEHTSPLPGTSMPNISSIWSNSAAVPPSDSQPLMSDQAIFQALQAQQQQQQQLAAWTNQQNVAALNRISNPHSTAGPLNNNRFQGLAAGPQQAHLQALQHQLAMRRNQNLQTMNSGLHRSTSFQPTSLGVPKGPGYSSWSNGQASLSNIIYNNATMRNNSTLFNSLHHSNSPSGRVTTYNGVPPGRKLNFGSHTIAPRLNRSFSTPTNYNGFGGSQLSPLPSIEDNPFFKMPADASSASGNMLSNLQERSSLDTMQMGAMDSQLYDIFRSDNGIGGKWHDLGRDNGSNLFDDGRMNLGTYDPIAANQNRISPLDDYGRERYSKKVFVGGLPPDIDEEEIQASFRHFGPLIVDWPHKAESKSYFPPKGYAFLLFQSEISVQNLIHCCMKDDDKLYLCVSSPTIKDKPVQIRPWNLADSDFVLDGSQPLDPRKTIFVGGVPRPLRAVELAMIMDRLYGGVCYAGIDVDPELKYPKGAGRVAFANQQNYISAISERFVRLQHGDIDKRVEVKPYVLDDQLCDECQGVRCGGKFAPFFCASVTCLQYYCEQCWAIIHAQPGREFHKPLVKEGADRSPRSMSFRW